jgi:hypothetical protein
MLANAGIIVTARDAPGRPAGVSRVTTDFADRCYPPGLAVDWAC